jgi:hypothetical protein
MKGESESEKSDSISKIFYLRRIRITGCLMKSLKDEESTAKMVPFN